MSIKQIISAREKDLGEFSVRRLLPHGKQQMVGPWIFFDHMGPAEFQPGSGINVRPHPHINLATVTYLFEGEILHRDSLGNTLSIHPGDVNLMVAGKGITHSERETEQVKNTIHRLHGLQLWHVLPADEEEIDPAFYHYKSEQLPAFSQSNVELKLIMGSAYGYKSPVKTFADTLYLEAKLTAGDRLELPDAEQQAIYIVTGNVVIDGEQISKNNLVVIDDNSTGSIEATKDTQIAIIGGQKMSPRFIEWNFVSTRAERIEKAKQDWQNGLFAKVVGDEKEFIPLP